jgi:hypothetical protein
MINLIPADFRIESGVILLKLRFRDRNSYSKLLPQKCVEILLLASLIVAIARLSFCVFFHSFVSCPDGEIHLSDSR